MIPADLLDKLREKDPELWGKIARGIPLKPCGEFMTYDHSETVAHQYQDVYIPFGELLPEVAFARLQHCLQEAIRTRGWHLYQIRNDDLPEKPCFVSIYNPTEGIKEHDSHQNGEGSTEAEALCLAYLEAIEAIRP